MQIEQNPAIALRKQIQALSLPGFLRWDTSGQALLLSDAPKHTPFYTYMESIAASGIFCLTVGNLLFIDLPHKAYEQIASMTFFMPGPWREPYITIQSQLSGILARDVLSQTNEQVNISLLRAAMLACARGEDYFIQFVHTISRYDAVALREKKMKTIHACAALCAHYLYSQLGIGMPMRVQAPCDMEL